MQKLLIFIIVLFCAFLFAFSFHQNIKVIEDNGIIIVKIPKNHILEPFVSNKVETNKTIFNQNNFLLSINAGYFDTINKQTTSFVTINEKEILNPTTNKNLIQNPELKNNIDKILNRSELRYIKCGNKYKYTIQNHFDTPEKNCKIIHALQAGPQLLPKITAEEEFFIVKENNKITRNSISTTTKKPRIAVGLTKNNSINIFIATKTNPLTLKEFSNYIKKHEIISALNLDGGGSVSFNYQDYDIFSDHKNTRRQVKSFLIIKKY